MTDQDLPARATKLLKWLDTEAENAGAGDVPPSYHWRAAADVVRALVAEVERLQAAHATLNAALEQRVKAWRKSANEPGYGDYYAGKDAAYVGCADDVEAALAAAIRGYAKAKFRAKHPCECEQGDYATGYPGFTCHVHEVFDRVMPRYLRILKRAMRDSGPQEPRT